MQNYEGLEDNIRYDLNDCISKGFLKQDPIRLDHKGKNWLIWLHKK